MKKKILTLLVLLMTAVTGAWAQYESHWPDFNEQDYESSNPIVAAIQIDGVTITADDPRWDALEIAFFVGDECRGNGNYLYNGYVVEFGDLFPVIDGVAIFCNNAGEQVSFKMYDHINGILYEDCVVTYLGEPKTILTGEEHIEGWYDPDNPVILSFTTPEPEPAESSVTVTEITKNQWQFTMPAYDVELEVEYYDEVTLTDGQAITALNTHAGKEIWVNYTRSFTEGKTSTVCLPFAYTKKEGDGSFYAFTNIEKVGSEYVATMTEPAATTLTANTPYLYLPNATGNVDFGGAYTIPASLTAGSTTSNGWTFKGTYSTIEWTTAPTGTYGFAAQDQDGIYQGQFVQVGDYVRIKPMRCYLENESFAGARGMNRAAEQLPETIKVRLIGADGTVTGIGTISTKTGEGTIDKDAWYSLDGRRIEGKPSTKGVYINNGNKVVIK